MKVKYIGEYPIGVIDFVTYKIIKPGEALEPNKEYEIPDNVPKYLKKAIEIDKNFEIMSIRSIAPPRILKEKEDE